MHNSREHLLRQKIEWQQLEKSRRKKEEAGRIRAIYLRPVPAEQADTAVFEARACTEGLQESIGVEVGGQGCFLVRAAEWQAAILLEVALKQDATFDQLDAFNFLVELGYVATDFEKVPDDVATLVRSDGTAFLRPFEAIVSYFSKGRAFESIGHGSNRSWRLDMEIRSNITNNRAKRKKILDRADGCLSR